MFHAPGLFPAVLGYVFDPVLLTVSVAVGLVCAETKKAVLAGAIAAGTLILLPHLLHAGPLRHLPLFGLIPAIPAGMLVSGLVCALKGALSTPERRRPQNEETPDSVPRPLRPANADAAARYTDAAARHMDAAARLMEAAARCAETARPARRRPPLRRFRTTRKSDRATRPASDSTGDRTPSHE